MLLVAGSQFLIVPCCCSWLAIAIANRQLKSKIENALPSVTFHYVGDYNHVAADVSPRKLPRHAAAAALTSFEAA